MEVSVQKGHQELQGYHALEQIEPELDGYLLVQETELESHDPASHHPSQQPNVQVCGLIDVSLVYNMFD